MLFFIIFSFFTNSSTRGIGNKKRNTEQQIDSENGMMHRDVMQSIFCHRDYAKILKKEKLVDNALAIQSDQFQVLQFVTFYERSRKNHKWNGITKKLKQRSWNKEWFLSSASSHLFFYPGTFDSWALFHLSFLSIDGGKDNDDEWHETHHRHLRHTQIHGPRPPPVDGKRKRRSRHVIRSFLASFLQKIPKSLCFLQSHQMCFPLFLFAICEWRTKKILSFFVSYKKPLKPITFLNLDF